MFCYYLEFRVIDSSHQNEKQQRFFPSCSCSILELQKRWSLFLLQLKLDFINAIPMFYKPSKHETLTKSCFNPLTAGAAYIRVFIFY